MCQGRRGVKKNALLVPGEEKVLGQLHFARHRSGLL